MTASRIVFDVTRLCVIEVMKPLPLVTYVELSEATVCPRMKPDAVEPIWATVPAEFLRSQTDRSAAPPSAVHALPLVQWQTTFVSTRQTVALGQGASVGAAVVMFKSMFVVLLAAAVCRLKSVTFRGIGVPVVPDSRRVI